jgi:ABC-type dipeptide/oligopeptide/nickel transport system permease component
MAGTLFGYLIGGAVVLEGLFSFGGMGQYLVQAVQSADLTAMQGFLIVAAAVSLVIFLQVDLVNMTLDPRRRPGVRAKA